MSNRLKNDGVAELCEHMQEKKLLLKIEARMLYVQVLTPPTNGVGRLLKGRIYGG